MAARVCAYELAGAGGKGDSVQHSERVKELVQFLLRELLKLHKPRYVPRGVRIR